MHKYYSATHGKWKSVIIFETVAKTEILRALYEAKLLILPTGAHFWRQIPKYLLRRIF